MFYAKSLKVLRYRLTAEICLYISAVYSKSARQFTLRKCLLAERLTTLQVQTCLSIGKAAYAILFVCDEFMRFVEAWLDLDDLVLCLCCLCARLFYIKRSDCGSAYKQVWYVYDGNKKANRSIRIMQRAETIKGNRIE